VTRTYGGLIRELGLTPCHGIGPTGHYCNLDHNAGASDPGMVHIVDGPLGRWTDIKRFLLLCARAKDSTLWASYDEPVWLKVYRGHVAARAVGKRLHIRVPTAYYVFDKLLVLSGTTGLSDDIPLRKQAFNWSRR
jgi:hypothetical protein